MSKKEIKFSIRLDINGKEQVTAATRQVAELSKATTTANTLTAALGDTFSKFSKVTQALTSVTQAMSSYTAAYRGAEAANTRLTTVMQERMNASQQDIAAIQSTIKAQSQLGVISGSIQKAGAQQVATFLTQKESLLTLIPAINDLVAQQKGLNASQQDAQNIGNLFGKAMQGQTTALRRVGISFTDVQEKILKTGTEQERAAMLAEVVTQNVGHMNQALAQTSAGSLKQMQNSFASLKVKVGEFADYLQKPIERINQWGQLIETTKQVREAFSSIRGGIISFYQSAVTTAQTVALAYGKLRQTLTITAYAISTSFKAVATGAVTLGAALRGAAVSAAVAKVALRTLLVATGVGAAVLALGYAFEKLIAYFDKSTTSTNKDTEAIRRNREETERSNAVKQAVNDVQKNAASRYADEITRVQQLTAIIHNNTLKYSERFNAIKKLQGIIPSYQAQIQKDGSIYERNAAAVQKYISKLQALAMAEASFDRIKEIYKEKYQLERSNYNDRKAVTEIDKSVSNNNGSVPASEVYSSVNAQTDEMKENNGFVYYTKKKGKYNTAANHTALKKRNSITTNINARSGKLYDLDQELNDILKNQTPESLELLKSYQLQGGYNRNPAEFATPTPTKGSTTPAPSTPAPTAAPEKGSLKWYDSEISKLKEEAEATADLTLSKEKLSQADALQKQRTTLAIQLGIEQPKPQEVKNALQQLQDQLQAAEEDFNAATTIDAKVAASTKVSELQQQIDEQTHGQVTIKAAVSPTFTQSGSVEDKRKSYNNAQQRIETIKTDYQLGIIGKDEALNQIQDINAQLSSLKLKPLKVDLDTTQAQRAATDWASTSQQAWQSVSGGINSITSLNETLRGNGSAWEKASAVINTFFSVMQSVTTIMNLFNALQAVSTGLKKADTVEETTNTQATLANTTAKGGEAIANATASGAKLPWPLNIAAIAAGVAAVVAAIATIASLAFASGGIVPGTSTSGDHIVARVNSGEMILNHRQQARLFQIANTPVTTPTISTAPTASPIINLPPTTQNLQPTPLDINLHGKISGRDLKLILDKRQTILDRT